MHPPSCLPPAPFPSRALPQAASKAGDGAAAGGNRVLIGCERGQGRGGKGCGGGSGGSGGSGGGGGGCACDFGSAGGAGFVSWGAREAEGG